MEKMFDLKFIAKSRILTSGLNLFQHLNLAGGHLREDGRKGYDIAFVDMVLYFRCMLYFEASREVVL